MHVLVINCGSSSIKAAVLDPETGVRAATLRAQRVGQPGATVKIQGSIEQSHEAAGLDLATVLDRYLPELIQAAGGELQGVGHRVVHGGDRYTAPTWLDKAAVDAIEALSPLAPLHNPANVAGIRAARRLLPDLPHIAVFDTAFHATLPRRSRTYALPQELTERHGLRRFGFHGTSHAWTSRQVARHMKSDVRDLRIITCHLGNGASACAVEFGRSVETSMGLTPLEGLVMGTRPGDVDAGLLLRLMREEGLDVDGLDDLLNRQSGLAGLSGVGNDLRDIEARASQGDDRCRLALHVFTHRLRRYIGGYAAVMGGVDAIAFTGGIGENSALVRHRTLQRLGFLGARLNEDKNRDAAVDISTPVVGIHQGSTGIHGDPQASIGIHKDL